MLLRTGKPTERSSSASVRFVHKRKADGVDGSRRIADRPLSASRGLARITHKLARIASRSKADEQTEDSMPTLFKRPRSPYWIIRYVDRHGQPKERSSKCRDRRRALGIGHDLEERERDIRAGRISPAEIDAESAALRPISEHLEAHLAAETERKLHPRHLAGKRASLVRYFEAERIRYLGEIDAESIRRHMRHLVEVGPRVAEDGRATRRRDEQRRSRDEATRPLSARSANVVRSNVLRFLNWAVEERRLAVHPCPGRSVPMLNEATDRRRLRRPYTDAELEALLRHVGRAPRANVYRLAVLTGLRREELALLRWGDVELADGEPCLRLRANTTKNRKAESVPLHPDAIAILEEMRPEDAEARDRVVGRMPTVLQLYRDLDAAGVQRLEGRRAVPDAGGRVLDFHAFRTTLGTMLAKAGVPTLHAKRIMRHASIETTDRHYTGLELADLGRQIERIGSRLVPTKVPTSTAPERANRCRRLRTSRPGRDNASRAEALSVARLSDDVRGVASKRVNGLEPSTFSLGSCTSNRVDGSQGVAMPTLASLRGDGDPGSANKSANMVGADAARSAVLADLFAVLGSLPLDSIEALLAVARSMTAGGGTASEADRRHG